jgi:hypothetical protein
MKAFVGEVDHFGLRRLLPEDVVLREMLGHYTRAHRTEATTVIRVLLDDRDAEVIRAKIVAGRFDDACGQLLNQAVELVALCPVVPDYTPVNR